tara:strand:- start:749 stop:1030 length:282 start_codon:yes stop_codon:yes gene_type:complete
MTKKDYSYVVISISNNLQEIQGVYQSIEAASYGARLALSTLFPKHGDEVKIIRVEVISTEEALIKLEKSEPKDIFDKCEDGFCPMPVQHPEVS